MLVAISNPKKSNIKAFKLSQKSDGCSKNKWFGGRSAKIPGLCTRLRQANTFTTVKPQDLVHLDRYLVQAWAVASKFSTGGSAVLGSTHTGVLNSDPNVLDPEV